MVDPEKIEEIMEQVEILAKAGDMGHVTVQVSPSLFWDILRAMETLQAS